MIDLCLFLWGTQQEPRAGTENMCSQQMRWVMKAEGSEVCTERGFSVDSSFKCDELTALQKTTPPTTRKNAHSLCYLGAVRKESLSFRNQQGKQTIPIPVVVLALLLCYVLQCYLVTRAFYHCVLTAKIW